MAKSKLISIEVGDNSGDGHGQSKSFFIETEHSVEDIQKAYLLGRAIIGVDISSLCEEFEDCTISKADLKKINKWLKPKLTDCMLMPDDFFNIWLRTVQLGNPSLKIQALNASNYIDIGGYGLFG